MNFGTEDPQLVIVVGANQLGHLKEVVCFVHWSFVCIHIPCILFQRYTLL